MFLQFMINLRKKISYFVSTVHVLDDSVHIIPMLIGDNKTSLIICFYRKCDHISSKCQHRQLKNVSIDHDSSS